MTEKRTTKRQRASSFSDTYGEDWESKIAALEADLIAVAQSGICNRKKKQSLSGKGHDSKKNGSGK